MADKPKCDMCGGPDAAPAVSKDENTTLTLVKRGDEAERFVHVTLSWSADGCAAGHVLNLCGQCKAATIQALV